MKIVFFYLLAILAMPNISHAKSSFTDILWKENLPLFQKTLMMPFNQEMAKGTLPKEKFIYYLKQDIIYLNIYARALAILAGKSKNNDEAEFLLQSSLNALIAEKELHQAFLKEWKAPGEKLEEITREPITAMYGDFLMTTVYNEPYEVGLAAILPCFWIYFQIGKYFNDKPLVKAGVNIYQPWINNYSSAAFESSLKQLLNYINRQAGNFPARQVSMKKAYKQAALLEYMFWEAAYNNHLYPLLKNN